MNYIMALDAGTTSSRTVIYDENAKVVGISQKEFRQIYPHPSWVEHDPEEIWETQLFTMKEALKKASLLPEDIKALGITNQRETTVVWNKATGEPLYNAIVWQCRRTSEMCDELGEIRGFSEYVEESDPYRRRAVESSHSLCIDSVLPELLYRSDTCYITANSRDECSFIALIRKVAGNVESASGTSHSHPVPAFLEDFLYLILTAGRPVHVRVSLHPVFILSFRALGSPHPYVDHNLGRAYNCNHVVLLYHILSDHQTKILPPMNSLIIELLGM